MTSTLEARIRNRGGKWGVRSFRLALAAQDRNGTGQLTVDDVSSAIGLFGVIPPKLSEVSAFCQSCRTAQQGASTSASASTTSLADVMRYVSLPLSRDCLTYISFSYKQICAEYGATFRLGGRPLPTVEFICQVVRIHQHPDVESAAVSVRNALFCYYTMWGLPLSSTVPAEVFLEFHADLVAGLSGQASLDLIRRLYNVDDARVAEQGREELKSLVPNREEADRIFDTLDTVGNHKLSLAQLDLAVIRMWPTMNFKPAIMRAYKLADADGSGLLSKSEFFQFLHYLVAYNSALEKFRAIDTNKDGRISFDEMRKQKQRLGLKDMSDTELREIFRAMDTNNGGLVLFEEFAVFLAKRRGDEQMSKVTNSF